MRTRTFLAAGLLFAGAFAADAQTVSVERTGCLPTEENGVVRATASPAAGQTPRLYFRWKEHEDFYWVTMEPEAGGRFWAVPPKPEQRNENVEIYGAIVDAAGKAVARSEVQIVKVTSDCRVQLNAKERGVAENLTVGETSPKQQGKKVMAFLCDGVVTRVNSEGVRRSDEVCRACVIAWWPRKALLGPIAAGFVGIVVTDEGPEPSPSRP
ncbi:MAG TPA: hypothetical protein VKK31_23130 [Thermoanaerobaculia bacterium]|nr:hypothetical protein [Thermoanaerobaculia bacterium]